MISNKLDAKFTGIIVKVKDGTIVPDDEYVVFLAKDNAFWDALLFYERRCEEIGCDVAQLASVGRMIERVRAWRMNNPNKLKNPDAKGEKLLA